MRPEHLIIVDPNDPKAAFAGAVKIIEHLANSTILYVDTPAGQLIVEGEGETSTRSRVKPSASGSTRAMPACSARQGRRSESGPVAEVVGIGLA